MNAQFRKWRIPLITASVVLVYLLPFLALNGFGGAFLKLDGIQGESISKGYEKQIDVRSFSWDLKRPVAYSGGSGGLQAPEIGEFTFTHNFDRASPLIAANMFTGTPIPDATLTVTTDKDGVFVPYLILNFTEVFITSTKSAGDGGDLPGEEVTFSYQKVVMDYMELDSKGAVISTTSTSWEQNSK